MVTYGYDTGSRLTDVTDTLGSVARITFDAYSKADLVTYAYGSMSARTWNRDYDLTAGVIRVQDPNGNDLRYKYDPVGRLDAITDPFKVPHVDPMVPLPCTREAVSCPHRSVCGNGGSVAHVESARLLGLG